MVHSKSIEDALNRWDISRTKSESVRHFFKAAPGNVPTQQAFSQDRRFEEVDTDRSKGCIRDVEHAFSKDGGLAVLTGNLAVDGCIVKTAGVDESILKFEGRRGFSKARTPPSKAFWAARSRPATSSWFATRARAADPACRRCCIRPATSNRRGSEKYAL
jgi:hypothetical protein